jgi:hypothetical protein
MSLLVYLILLADPFSARTTVSSSSLVAFTVNTPLRFDTLAHDSVDFIRFNGVPVTNEVGWPEVPSLLFFVALPDSVEPEVSWAFHGMIEGEGLPVYPAPLDSVVNTRTPAVEEYFRQDSTAYTSDEWWPEEPVTVLDEMRLFDQRLLVIQVLPAAFRASTNTLRTYGGFSVAVNFDSTEAEQNQLGLGPFQPLVVGSSIVGYHPLEQSLAPLPRVYRDFDLVTGPTRVPGYVILVATGLDGEWIDDLAEHRVERDRMDVAIVTTEEVMDEFGGNETALTDDIIREFTDAMWQWGNGSRRPSYLLLVGDHEDAAFCEEDWFLPTHLFYVPPEEQGYANDNWYAYFNAPGEDVAFPDMMVGRLSVKGADTLEVMIGNLIEMDQPIETAPLVDRSRRITRLTGTGDEDENTHIQSYQNWGPSLEWTDGFCEWLGYEYVHHYCGDGRDWTSQDSSHISSLEWVASCDEVFSEGAGVIFYSNHGDYHMFSAGLEWDTLYCGQNKGAPDSTFNCLAADDVEPDQYHQPPFVLMLCCSAGTFNHTDAQHPRTQWPELCISSCGETTSYDFRTDCLAEAVLKNTDCPVAGVFCGSLSSQTDCYPVYGSGILESIYTYGQSRLGEAIASARLREASSFGLPGSYNKELGQFNLLGDPALDIGDRAKYPDCCDLVVYPEALVVDEYAWIDHHHCTTHISAEVRNNGGAASGAFDLRFTVSSGEESDVVAVECAGLAPGESQEVGLDWTDSWFEPSIELTLEAVADPAEECDDIWRPNNTATQVVTIFDDYPFQEGWPAKPAGVVVCTPILVNIDGDVAREVVTLSGTLLEAWDSNGSRLWRSDIPLTDIMAADLDGDHQTEFIGRSSTGVAVLNNNGECLWQESVEADVMAAADLAAEEGIELVLGEGPTLSLYYWDAVNEELDLLDSQTWSFDFNPTAQSLCCAHLNDDGYSEAVYYCNYGGSGLFDPSYYSINVYDWEADTTLSERSYGPLQGYTPPNSTLCAGLLDEEVSVGFPLGTYNPDTEYPAQLLDPLSSATPTDCEPGNSEASHAIHGLFADWSSIIPGLDTFIVPAENQCLAWRLDGSPVISWPSDFQGSVYVTPPALGDLDDDHVVDVLASTWYNDNGVVYCLNSGASAPITLDFPYTLPFGVFVTSGFSIADIDGDAVPEIVFGTSDGLLHCWEVGECTAGYAPWPQTRHDASRDGALE